MRKSPNNVAGLAHDRVAEGKGRQGTESNPPAVDLVARAEGGENHI
jgi:hypothetical protein